MKNLAIKYCSLTLHYASDSVRTTTRSYGWDWPSKHRFSRNIKSSASVHILKPPCVTLSSLYSSTAFHQQHTYMNLSSAVCCSRRQTSSWCHWAAEGSASTPDRLSSASWDRYFCEWEHRKSTHLQYKIYFYINNTHCEWSDYTKV